MKTLWTMLTAALLAAAPGVPPSADGTEAVWRLVEASAEVRDPERRKDLLREAEAVARGALEGHETEVEPRYALAVVLGLRAGVEGKREAVRLASELSAELDTILSIDPNHVGARHILGRLHAAVRRMGRLSRWVAISLLGGEQLEEATWEAAEENLAFAERHAPEVADHHLQLALLYRDTDRPERAAAELLHVMELQATRASELAVQAQAMRAWDELDETFRVASTN